ncbi:MAG: ATP synthase subunit I [Pseudomonadales bacterium]|nr:ATP synthase subunit I [Pseudomonadales bacterium]
MTILVPLLFLLSGYAAGRLHFALLRRNTELYLQGGAVARAVGMQLTRLAFIALVLVVAAYFGAASLVACAVGIMLARLVVLRRAVREEKYTGGGIKE